LPVEPTSFVDRADEVRDVSEALRRAQLVTATGVGGVGKTGLAVQAAADLLSAVPDSAWSCELAAAGDAETLAQVVASTLGVVQGAGRSLERSILEFLRPSHPLRVLDNCSIPLCNVPHRRQRYNYSMEEEPCASGPAGGFGVHDFSPVLTGPWHPDVDSPAIGGFTGLGFRPDQVFPDADRVGANCGGIAR
jgi:hypothetical protein